MLDILALEPGSLVLDPWNGSGTTTARSAVSGLRSIGLDVNPALVLVGRGRLLQSDVSESITPLAAEILDAAGAVRQPLPEEPLESWLQQRSALLVRGVERAIQKVLVDHATYEPIADRGLSHLSSLAAVFYVALFGTLRDKLRGFRGSNPTWVRTPKAKEDRVELDEREFSAAFRDHCARLTTYITKQGLSGTGSRLAAVKSGDSTAIDLGKVLANAVITSPPYCTRIDYVIATAPELAVLGYGSAGLRALRDAMIGTPTMHGEETDVHFGPKVGSLLQAIKKHPSKASATYYHTYYKQYFTSMAKSIESVTDCCVANAEMVFVVQDSYYKDIHVDLGPLTGELAKERGWRVTDTRTFEVPRTRAAVNSGARKYRDSFDAVEAAIFLTRDSA